MIKVSRFLQGCGDVIKSFTIERLPYSTDTQLKIFDQRHDQLPLFSGRYIFILSGKTSFFLPFNGGKCLSIVTKWWNGKTLVKKKKELEKTLIKIP